MDHYQAAADGYEELLIRQSIPAVSRLYQRERHKVCKKAKARVRNTLALLRTQIELN